MSALLQCFGIIRKNGFESIAACIDEHSGIVEQRRFGKEHFSVASGGFDNGGQEGKTFTVEAGRGAVVYWFSNELKNCVSKLCVFVVLTKGTVPIAPSLKLNSAISLFMMNAFFDLDTKR